MENERIAKLETQFRYIEKCLGEIEGNLKQITINELPHLTDQIASLDKRVAVLTVKVAAGAAIASAIGSAVMNWIFR